MSSQLAARALSLTCKGAEGALEVSGSDLIAPADSSCPPGETCQKPQENLGKESRWPWRLDSAIGGRAASVSDAGWG